MKYRLSNREIAEACALWVQEKVGGKGGTYRFEPSLEEGALVVDIEIFDERV